MSGGAPMIVPRMHVSPGPSAPRRRLRMVPLAALLATYLAAAGTVWVALGQPLPSVGGGQAGAPSVPPGAALPASAGTAAPSEPPGRAIPILMYHGTEAPPPGAPYPDLWVGAGRYAAQMAMLQRRGYHAITMRQAHAYWTGRAPAPRNPVVITFDDGFASHARVALPVMRRLGWRGVLYLEAGALKTLGPQGIPASDVHRLLDAGWELGSHTIDHPDLTTLAPDRLRYEIAYSRTFLARRFGVPVDAFCYPAGRHDRAAAAEVRRAGYLTATTTAPGLARRDRPMELARIRVEGTDTPGTLEERLRVAGSVPDRRGAAAPVTVADGD